MQKILLCLLAGLLFSCAKEPCDLEDIYHQSTRTCAKEPCPPKAPSEGPGSAVSPHAGVDTATIEESFANTHRAFLYLPALPTPKTAPVILFLHGYFDATPERYDAMLRHYARNGYIVIYPTYGNAVYARAWPENAEEAFKRALAYISGHSAIQPDLGNVAFVGHSIGGILAFRLAEGIGTGSTTLPRPKIIITSDAAGIATIAYPHVAIDDLSRIPRDTKMLLMMAEETYKARFKEDDRCENDAKKPESNCNGFSANLRAVKRTPQIPAANKVALLIASDRRGDNELKSDHNGAQGECGDEKKPINAIDTWGYWRNTVTALNSVLKNQGEFDSLRSAENLKAGLWSDGSPAKPALSLDSCFQANQCPTL